MTQHGPTGPAAYRKAQERAASSGGMNDAALRTLTALILRADAEVFYTKEEKRAFVKTGDWRAIVALARGMTR